MLILLLCDWLIEGWALEDVPDDEEDEGAVCVSVWEGEGDDPATLTTMSSDIIRYRQNRIYSNSHCSTRHRMHWYVCRELRGERDNPTCKSSSRLPVPGLITRFLSHFWSNLPQEQRQITSESTQPFFSYNGENYISHQKVTICRLKVWQPAAEVLPTCLLD